jgi:hypothetical protein
MATENTVLRSKIIINRLQAYRSPSLATIVPFPTPYEDFSQSLHWRSRVHLFVLRLLQQLLPGPDGDTCDVDDGCCKVASFPAGPKKGARL